MNFEILKEAFASLIVKQRRPNLKNMTESERKAYRSHQRLVRRYAVVLQYFFISLLVLIIVIVIVTSVLLKKSKTKPVEEIPIEAVEETLEPEPEPEPEPIVYPYTATETASTKSISSEVISEYAIVINPDTDEVLAAKNAYTRMNPASMTKILTVLTAAEHMDISELDKPATISQEATDFAYKNDCSTAGFTVGETVTVKDLYYGTILPSGGDAAAELGIYVAGSTDAFVDMMNEELEKLGLSETSHVTNMIGIHGEDHYSTAYDMAIILEAAMDNEITRDVLSAHVYYTTPSTVNPEGLIMSNWFLRRIEDRKFGGTIQGAKTGYTVKAGSCAASSETTFGGTNLICVTGKSTSSWNAIADHVTLYKMFAESETKSEQ